MNLRIDVTQEDIEQGKRGDSRACMAHRAIDRATEGGLGEFGVHYAFCEGWLKFPDFRTLNLPEGIGARISRWDAGAPTEPFSFELDMSPLLQEAGI